MLAGLLGGMMAVLAIIVFLTSKVSVYEIPLKDTDEDVNTDVVFTRMLPKSDVGVLSLRADPDYMKLAARYPGLVSVLSRRNTFWTVSCFGAALRGTWLIAAAACRSVEPQRVLSHADVAVPLRNWHLHTTYSLKDNSSAKKFDIALIEAESDIIPPADRTGLGLEYNLEAAVWKTVLAPDNRLFLTDEITSFPIKKADNKKCEKFFAINMTSSMICINLSQNDVCLTSSFGPLYENGIPAAVMAITTSNCKFKLAIFYNLSFYQPWIDLVQQQTFRTNIFGNNSIDDVEYVFI